MLVRFRLVLGILPDLKAAVSRRAGRMELREGKVAALPHRDENFDIAFSAHSIFFWADPIAALKKLRRVLRAGGLLAVTIQPKDKWDANRRAIHGMTLYVSGDSLEMLAAAGLREVRDESPPAQDRAQLECILGNK